MPDPPVYGAKIVGLHPGNPARGKPAVQGFICLFDGGSGAPVALLDGAEITATRTAAASALATRELARPDASSHGIFGTGVQAAAHLDAISCIRDVRNVLVWGRDHAKAKHFASQHASRGGPEITAIENPDHAAACDIVSVVTNSPVPVLQGKWLRPGAHLNLVGAHEPEDRETDSETAARSAIFVDSRQGALCESGDILIPIAEGVIGEEDIQGEIGEVLLGKVPGRRGNGQITLYKSLGVIAQDLYAAAHVYGAARERGLGKIVELD